MLVFPWPSPKQTPNIRRFRLFSDSDDYEIFVPTMIIILKFYKQSGWSCAEFFIANHATAKQKGHAFAAPLSFVTIVNR